MNDSYRKLARYYDLIYDYKNYNKETDFIERILKKYALTKPMRILDLGCGTGGHTIPLAKRGYLCSGIDLSDEMIRIAQAKVLEYKLGNANFKIAGMQNFAVTSKFDAVISMSSAICFLKSFQEFKSALKRVSAALKKGGILLFDFWNGLVVINQFSPTKVKVCRTNKQKLVRISKTKLDYFKQLAIVDISVKLLQGKEVLDEFKDRHVVRYYFLDEMCNYLEMNGFKVLHLCPFGSFDKKVNIARDWNVTVVSRKI